MKVQKSTLVAGLCGLLMVLPACGIAGEEAKDAAAPTAMAMQPGQAATYAIGAGDVLSISVWKNQDLTRTVQVLPDGKISFPLVGQLDVSGMTVGELTKALQEKIAPFQADAVLSIEVQQVNSMMVYVIGRTNHPGRFALNGNINVLQALSLAGGLTPFAKKADIKIFREEKGGTKVFPFDYDDVTDGKDLSQNIELKRGDVVVVP